MRPASPSRIRILRVITRLNVGGPAQHAVFLTERLNGVAFSTTLAAGSLSHGEGDMGPLATSRGIAVRWIPALGNDQGWIGDLRALLRLYRLIRKEQPTIVHLHLLKARFLGGLAARLAGVPLVVETLHGHLLAAYYGRLKTRVILAVERFIGRWIADDIVVLSRSQQQELLGWGIGTPDKVHVVPLGLELHRFLATPRRAGVLRRELNIDRDTLLIGAVGRLVSIKGYIFLLQAVRRVSEIVGNRLAAVIVGDGPLRQVLETEAERLRIRHLVMFLGWRSDIEQVYSDIDVFVQPSLNEGTPVSLIEAMASGTPAVASRVGGVPDVVTHEHSGLLVPPGDSAALAEAILRFRRDPELTRRIADEARCAVYPRFDLRRMVAQLEELYLRRLTRFPSHEPFPVNTRSLIHHPRSTR